MRDLRIANRYAEALMKTAEETHVLKNVSDDLSMIQRSIKESHDFMLLLKSPIVKKEKKRQIFEAAFGKSVQPLTLQFLFLLSEKNREDVLLSIIEAFFRLQDEVLGIVNVQVTSASELSAQQKTQLTSCFEEYSKKKVRIEVNLDKKLIGGFVASIGDTMFDGSVKRQLELLRSRFTEELIGA
jgi:F-type H+-transporting ATPase subunit delta